MFKFLNRSADADGEAESTGPSSPHGAAHAARRDLLEQISDFLLRHELEVTSENLVFAHAAWSGAIPRLAQRITERECAGERITQAWVDENTPVEKSDDSLADQQAELDRLMTRLDTSISSFAATTSKASNATNAYGDSLEQHVGAISQVASSAPTAEMVASLAGIAKAMLERTRQVEHEMTRSAQEAETLRQSLDRARRDAEIDHLTGLPNRRAFEAVLEQEIREAQAEIDNLSVAICDIDHFKRVNDTHGHDTGDRIIQAVAQVLGRISGDRCHVARHGGEEFVVLFRGKSVTEAAAILDDARESLAARNFINRQNDEPIGQVTFSGGVANIFAHPDPREALRAADEALYRAKSEGRNRICRS